MRRIVIGVLTVAVLSYTFTASADRPLRAPSAPSACIERVVNGGFEAGPASPPWVQSSPNGERITNTLAYAGVYSARLGGYNNAVDVISQTVSIPVTATTVSLSYHWQVTTTEVSTITRYDVLTVTLRTNSGAVSQTLQAVDNLSTQNQWLTSTFTLPVYPGQSFRIQFEARSDSSLVSAFFIDNVSLRICELTQRVSLPLITFIGCSPAGITDPLFASQPNLLQINADDAWQACEQGAPEVVVAVIDTGADLDHPDLVANLLPGKDYIDDPANGNNPPDDGNGHGTHVSGIVGAPINGIGVVGVAPKTRLLPVRVLNNAGSGTASGVAAGITYAANNAHILNLSLGSVSASSAIQTAVSFAAVTKGRLVVAAAGNCGDASFLANGCQYQDQPSYPAAYSVTYPNVMAVAAVDGADQQASFSNQGTFLDYVTIAAPGVSINSTYTSPQYRSVSGTSQATPHVAGLAALIWARHPAYTAAQVRQAIELTAVDLGTPGKDIQYGWGRINAPPALGLSNLAPAAEPPAPRAELPPPADDRTAAFVPGRVLIQFKPDAGLDVIGQALAAFPGVSVAGQIVDLNIQLLRVPQGQEWALVDQLRALPNVVFAEPDYLIQLYPQP